MAERLTVESNESPYVTIEFGETVGHTVLELLAQPIVLVDEDVTAHRPPQTTHTQQRTWDPIGNHPDTRTDIQSD